MIIRIEHAIASALLLTSLLLAPPPLLAEPMQFSFGVIANLFRVPGEEAPTIRAIADTDADNLAFVVVNGIKAAAEPCDDTLYLRRRALFDQAENGLIVSLAGTDWVNCIDSHRRSAAVERLNRIRELFFADEFSFGSSRIPLIRQSNTAKFRSFAENMRWTIGNVTFATINIPANNNNYRAAAGRNSEFEDRLIANREWLERVLAVANRTESDGIVLFCDADPLTQGRFLARFGFNQKRDGFSETRQYIKQLAKNFPGKVLLVYSKAVMDPGKTEKAPDIIWSENLGKIGVHSHWMKIHVSPESPTLFNIALP